MPPESDEAARLEAAYMAAACAPFATSIEAYASLANSAAPNSIIESNGNETASSTNAEPSSGNRSAFTGRQRVNILLIIEALLIPPT
jgi:hypothetical protein